MFHFDLKRDFRYSQLLFALDHLKAVQDIKKICKEALEHYPGDPVFLHLQQLATSAYERNRSTINEMPLPDQVKFQLREMGTVWVKPYPWASKINARTAESIAVANSALSKCSKLLRIKTSTVAISSSDKISYGMFATKNIHKDDIVLEARPVLSVNGSQLKQHMNLLNPLCGIRKTGSKTLGSCYNCSGSLEGIDQKYGFVCCAHLYFCSKDCKNLAKQYYHDALCGVNISHIYAAMEGEKCYLSGPEIAGLKWLRILAVCKQRGKHPLQHPLVANLTSHEGSAHDPWSLESRVIKPLRTLEMLGVDVFTDQWYDTWVLELLWYVNPLLETLFKTALTDVFPHRQRFRVNAVGTGEGSECEAWVDSSHAMFNHSCEDPPMLYCYQDKSSLKYHWCARREIKKGEEVFVSYIGDSLPQSTKERRELLNGWLSGECRCKRCLLG